MGRAGAPGMMNVCSRGWKNWTGERWLGLRIDKAGGRGSRSGQVMKGLVTPIKVLDFSLRATVVPLMSFKQESDVIRFV